ncbi:NAD(P)/FAD-dependent oxidoreductase [Actinomycetes bacterium M1A6_2h]
MSTPTAGSLVVVGASLAGLRAVESARKDGFEGRITLIGAEEHLPYDRPPLSKAALETGSDVDTTFRSHETLTNDLHVDVRLGASATALNPVDHTIETDSGSVPYDLAVLATGSTARTLPGTAGVSGIHTLRTVDDARAVKAALDAGARTVVIGAGFIGSEVASGARRRGLPVTIVEAMDVPLVRAVGVDMGRACSDLHLRNGVDLRCGVSVARVDTDGGRVRGVVLSDGSVIPADLVIVGIGADPATGWLASSGIEIDNGIVCDQYMMSSLPGVAAAGDVARWHNALFDTPMRLEHWTSAAEQGAAATRNLLAEPGAPTPYTTVPYFWSDWYDTRIQFVGVPAADETRIVSGDTDDGRFVALYRQGDRLAGALALNHQSHIMKYRNLISKSCTWADALEFAASRNTAVSRL